MSFTATGHRVPPSLASIRCSAFRLDASFAKAAATLAERCTRPKDRAWHVMLGTSCDAVQLKERGCSHTYLNQLRPTHTGQRPNLAWMLAIM